MALVRANTTKCYPNTEHQTAWRMVSGQPLEERGKVRNRLRILIWVYDDLSAGKNLHNLLYEIISDIG